MYKAKPIFKLLPKIEKGVVGYFLMDQTEYFNYIKQELAKMGFENLDPCGGNYNGYVILSKDHPLFEKDYDYINPLLDHNDFYIHGGLTFSNYPSAFDLRLEDDLFTTDDFWVVGFDTKHAGDTEEIWTQEKTLVETEFLQGAMQFLFGLTKEQLAKYEDKKEL